MSCARTAPIGVFDSGVGGLTVVLEILQQMPKESYIYYADTAHVPYGPRDPRELKSFAHDITGFLLDKGCKMIIIACNTSTSLAYEELRSKFKVPLIGVIEPGVDKALETTGNGRVGVVGTQATINSGAYQKMLFCKRPGITVEAVACPLFVPLVEKGMLEGEETESAVRKYLEPLKEKGIDTLILGCTHYPFLAPIIAKILGPGITKIDPARETVSRAKKILMDKGLLKEEGLSRHLYYASGEPASFRRTASLFLNEDIGLVHEVK